MVFGKGIGLAMTTNKLRGIRAAQTHDTCSAERAAPLRMRQYKHEQKPPHGCVRGCYFDKSRLRLFLVWFCGG
ncbi:RpiB/LacA/LacB family sugar-phosphate isomerase [Paracoccaceae bacterium]|nr:RpiB/LacA/LacB family sugar-phosphate isomerase [Paracoccaceae bacterium]